MCACLCSKQGRMLNIIKNSGFDHKLLQSNTWPIKMPAVGSECTDIEAFVFMDEFATMMRKSGVHTVVSEMAKKPCQRWKSEAYENALRFIDTCMDPKKLYVQTDPMEWMLVFLMGTVSFGVDASPVQILTDDLMWAIFEQTRMHVPRIKYIKSPYDHEYPKWHGIKRVTANELLYQPKTEINGYDAIVKLKMGNYDDGIVICNFLEVVVHRMVHCKDGSEREQSLQALKVQFDVDHESLLQLPLITMMYYDRAPCNDYYGMRFDIGASVRVPCVHGKYEPLDELNSMTPSVFADKCYVPYRSNTSRPLVTYVKMFRPLWGDGDK